MVKTALLPASAMQSPHVITTKSDIQAMNYTAIPGSASYAAAAPDGSLWVLSDQPAGTDKYIWHYFNGSWTNIPGLASRITVAPNGTLYALNTGGGAYSYSSSSGWTAFGGGCRDLTAAADGSLYVISNAGGADGAIWHYASGGWTQSPGAGNRLAASWDTRTYTNPSGTITPGGFYVINSAGSIYYLGSSGYIQIPGAASAVAPINGGLFVLGYPTNSNGNGLFYYNLDTPGWAAQSGAGVSISTNGSTLYIIGASGSIYSSPVSTVTNPPASIPQALYAATFTYVNSTANGIEEFALGPQGLLAASPFSINYGQLGTGAPGGPPTVLFGYSAPAGIAVNSSARAEIVNVSYPSGGPFVSNFDFAPCTVSSPYAALGGWIGGGGGASFDAADNLWQLGNNGAWNTAGITEYPAPQNQVPSTSTTAAVAGGFSQQTLGGDAIAFDGQQNLWTLGTDSQGNPAVLNLGRSPRGAIAPLSAIHGILTQLQNPVGVAIGPNNTVYVATVGAILVYASGSVGNVAPAAVISGANTRISSVSALAVDALGDIFVGQSVAPQILEFSPKSSGNVSPVATVVTQGSAVEGLAVGPLPFSQSMTVHPASITLSGQQSDQVIVWDSTCADQVQFTSDNSAVYRPPTAIQTGHGLIVTNNATSPGTAHVTATSSTGQSAVFTVNVVATPPPIHF